MKRTGICILLIVTLLSTMVLPTFAAMPENNTVEPLWTNTSNIDFNVGFIDGVGYAESGVIAKYSPKTFNIATYVYIKSGSDWVYVTESHHSKTGMAIITSCAFDAVLWADYKVEYVFTVSGNGVDEVIPMTAYATYLPS